MPNPPTLFSISVKTIAAALVHGDELVQDILEIPPILFDALMESLPPLVLEKIDELLVSSLGSFCQEGFATTNVGRGSKRGRHEDSNATWKMLFRQRWPENIKYIGAQDFSGQCNLKNQIVDSQQLYWEKHLQDCLDEAAEIALLPTFRGCISELMVSDKIMGAIGHKRDENCACANLAYQFKRYGRYMRYLSLQNVLCVEETCELIRFCKLSHMVFRRVISKNQVNGVCMLVNQHRETLSSLEFVYCQVPPAMLDQICSSICHEGSQTHRIQHFHIKSSAISESKSSIAPDGLLSFLSSGRLLKSICFCDTKMQSNYAKSIIDTLLGSSSGVVTLEISDNNLAGWLSKVDKKLLGLSSSFSPDMSLKSLSSLSLRGNNLHKEDAEVLHHILTRMPVLQSLDISDNPIMDVGIRSLISYFVHAVVKAYPLLDIKIDNCNLSVTGVTELLSSLPPLREPLNTLSIADNNLGSSIAEPLSRFLDASGVRVLNIEDVGLGTLGFQQFEDNMPNKMALYSINISKNRGGIRAAHFISKILLHSPNLVSVNAGGNIMPPESVVIIHNAMKRPHGKLELLDLSENPLLCKSDYVCRLLEFSRRGKPIVVAPLPLITPYDDDP